MTFSFETRCPKHDILLSALFKALLRFDPSD